MDFSFLEYNEKPLPRTLQAKDTVLILLSCAFSKKGAGYGFHGPIHFHVLKLLGQDQIHVSRLVSCKSYTLKHQSDAGV